MCVSVESQWKSPPTATRLVVAHKRPDLGPEDTLSLPRSAPLRPRWFVEFFSDKNQNRCLKIVPKQNTPKNIRKNHKSATEENKPTAHRTAEENHCKKRTASSFAERDAMVDRLGLGLARIFDRKKHNAAQTGASGGRTRGSISKWCGLISAGRAKQKPTTSGAREKLKYQNLKKRKQSAGIEMAKERTLRCESRDYSASAATGEAGNKTYSSVSRKERSEGGKK